MKLELPDMIEETQDMSNLVLVHDGCYAVATHNKSTAHVKLIKVKEF